MPENADHHLTASHTVKVLIVDDDPCVRDIVSRWLGDMEYSCVTADSAAAAWQALNEQAIDVLTLDITMPGQTGLELLHRIQQANIDVDIVMLTADADTDLAIEALTHGASGYLTKPVEADELLFHVRRAWERRQMIRQRRTYVLDLERMVRKQTNTIRRAHEETIHRLVSASMYRDEETGAHIKRVGLYSALLAKTLGWPADEADKIRMAAPMHDVGKIGIPDAILQKPGKLTDEEFEIMKTHTTIGANMLADSESPMLHMAHEIANYHHERWNGTGYPQGLSGPCIPESARIVAIVDVYDALSHDRVYRPAMPDERVLAILNEGRGTYFDPTLLDLFFEHLSGMRQIKSDHPDRWEATLGTSKVTEPKMECCFGANNELTCIAN